jgi:Ca2+-binding EF-hand superfamily protein
MVLVGTGIPETLQKVFVMLDTHNTGSISKQTLKSALLELKRRGYMSVSLSDDQLDKFLDNLVEKNKMELNAAAAAGDPTAAEAARLLAQKGPQIR